jgi:hypothetical protein
MERIMLWDNGTDHAMGSVMNDDRIESEPIELDLSELLGLGQLAKALTADKINPSELSRLLSKAGGEGGCT